MDVSVFLSLSDFLWILTEEKTGSRYFHFLYLQHRLQVLFNFLTLNMELR